MPQRPGDLRYEPAWRIEADLPPGGPDITGRACHCNVYDLRAVPNVRRITQVVVEFPSLPAAVEAALLDQVRALVERTVAAQTGGQDAP